MKKSIFGEPRRSGGIKLDPFFIEIALIIPVFALCCCSTLRTLGMAAKRADREQTYAAAVACAESWCELYSATGNAQLAAEELFGKKSAENCSDGMSFMIPCDKLFRYAPGDGGGAVYITESIEECKRDGLIYGQLLTSDIRIVWEGGTVEESAVCYAPYPLCIPDEEEDEE
ncbi:MAG: hypothetical protein ACI4J0_10750 [Huintestinicola sp.]|uniref:hypothetical protein n=1 Tax=Huintestinicola sp. TaxID=2981661 RepID=UPI003F011F00